MPGMPYHLEKGPWLSILEDYLNASTERLLEALDELRRVERGERRLSDLEVFHSPSFDGDPDYPTFQERRDHLLKDWLGVDAGGGFVARTVDQLTDDQRRDLELALGPIPELHDTVAEVGAFASAVAALPDASVTWPNTGFWFQYHGDVERIVASSFVRGIEVALGLEHDADPPDEGPNRRLPIELFWKCPQRWFEGWVTWRWNAAGGVGGVMIMLATPGSGKPVLENPDLGEGSTRPSSSSVADAEPAPVLPPASDPARNPQQSAMGMWVITHAGHAQLPVLSGARGTPAGEWHIPAFGPTYVGVGDVVCVQPSEADGGVRPFGRPFEPPVGQLA